jgi:hypothetical protein
MNISISRDGAEIGEWTEEQVLSFYKEGQLLPTDYYWKEGMTEWVQLYTMIKPAPAVATKPVLRTQVISVVESKFTQKAAPVRTSNMQQQPVVSPAAPVNVDKKPGLAGKLFGKLFRKQD